MNKVSTSIIVTFALILLTSGYHYIDKYLSGVVFLLLTCAIPVLVILILISIVKGLIGIYKNRHSLSLAICLPTIIYIVTPIIASFIDLTKLESKVVIRGCYEGTQNQAYILFRQDNTFELNWTGVFFYDEWFTGHWRKNGDTIVLKYSNKVAESLGDKLVIQNGYFKPVGKNADTIKYPFMFYLGYCKGKN